MSKIEGSLQQQELVICLQVQIQSIACWNLVCLWFGPLNLTSGVSCAEFTERFTKKKTAYTVYLAQSQNSQLFQIGTPTCARVLGELWAANRGFLFSLKFPALGAGKSGLAVVRRLLPRHIYPWHRLRHNIYCLVIGCGEAQACPPWESSWDIR